MTDQEKSNAMAANLDKKQRNFDKVFCYNYYNTTTTTNTTITIMLLI